MKVIFIVNPHAGFSGFRKQVGQAIARVTELGCTVSRVETESPGHATILAQMAVTEGYDVAVAVGGDGTINEVVNGLVGTSTALGVLPAGTANVYAADMKIPIATPLNSNAIQKAAEIIATGQRRRIDVGRLTLEDGTSRYFFMWCGIGLDAAITQARSQRKTNHRSIKYMAWFVAVVQLLFDYRGIQTTIKLDEVELNERIILAVVSNGQLYGRVWRLAPEAKMDDGLFDVGVMVGHRWMQIFKHGLNLSLGRHIQNPDFHLNHTTSMTLSTKYPLPVHVDGDPIGTTPITVEMIPSALDIIIPQNAPARLFLE